MTSAAQPAEEFDDVRIPPGDIVGKLFEHRHRSFAAAVVDRLGDVQALAASVHSGDQVGRK
jgi:hypothetical protein